MDLEGTISRYETKIQSSLRPQDVPAVVRYAVDQGGLFALLGCRFIGDRWVSGQHFTAEEDGSVRTRTLDPTTPGGFPFQVLGFEVTGRKLRKDRTHSGIPSHSPSLRVRLIVAAEAECTGGILEGWLY